MDTITREDLIRLRFVSDPVLSPDGSRTAYVIHNQNLKENSYESRLYLLNNETGKSLKLTDMGKEGPAIWLDSETLLFSAERGEADKAEPPAEKTCFYRLSLCGGEAEKAFEVPKKVSAIHLLEDGRFLLEVEDNLNPPPADMSKEELEEEKDYHVLEEIPFYADGGTYNSRERTALYVFHAETGKCEKITAPYFDTESVNISGNRIAYTGREYDTMATVWSMARLYDLTTGETTDLIPAETYDASDAVVAGDSVLIAMTDHVPYGTGQYKDFWKYDIASGEIRLLCKMNMDFHGWMSTDVHYGGGTVLKRVGNRLFMICQNAYRAELFALNCETGELSPAVPFNGCVNSFDVVGDRVVLCASEAAALADLYLVTDGKPERVTAANDAFLADKFVAKPKYIPFTDSDGVKIDGWVLEPKDFDPAKTYPGVLEIHGGPRGTYGEMFHHEMQMLCGDGCFVFFCNPRGGEGYGEEFADLRGKYGDIDYRDLMEFTDHVLKLYPQLDPARLGETGGSYGGFMSNWIEGHTDRFAAIVSCRSISNWVADFGACEFGYTFDANEVGATPWTGAAKMWDQSPLKYADRAKTPILFIHALSDYNCPFDQGREMFIAMKYHGVPSKMVLFEGESHSLSSSGKPKHRLRRLKELEDWFRQYLRFGEEA